MENVAILLAGYQFFKGIYYKSFAGIRIEIRLNEITNCLDVSSFIVSKGNLFGLTLLNSKSFEFLNVTLYEQVNQIQKIEVEMSSFSRFYVDEELVFQKPKKLKSKTSIQQDMDILSSVLVEGFFDKKIANMLLKKLTLILGDNDSFIVRACHRLSKINL